MRTLTIPKEGSFTSAIRHERLSARIGVWLGICFGLAFVTGLISHWYYLRDVPFFPPTRPVWGYRLTQGTHVISGTAAIPLLLVKLWSVYPKLFAEIPFGQGRRLVLNLLERASIAVLVAASIFQLVTGLANSAQWYPWAFSFRSTHYAVAWIAIGALLVHIAVKLPIIKAAYAEPLPEGPEDVPADPEADPEPDPESDPESDPATTPSRRAVLRTALAASAVVVLATAGSTVPFLRKISVLGVRTGEGPQGIPINKSAAAAKVTELAKDPGYRLVLSGPEGETTLDMADLAAMTQRTHELPIACVEGWSASGEWTGVRLSELLDLMGAPAEATIRLVSLQPSGAFRSSELPASFARDPLTMLALGLNGQALDIDHGFPCRLIAPNRPGVFQTKWIGRIEVIA